MSSTPQSQTIQNINGILAAASAMVAAYNQIVAVNNAWNDNGSLTIAQAMGTVALNADGTLGAADGAPNTAHPLNTATYAALQRAISVSDVTSMLTQLNNIVSYINGGALTATPGVRGVLNKATGG